MKACTCSTGGGNTGLPSCFGLFDVTKQAILVEYYKSDGSINGIDLTSVNELDQTYLDEKIKSLDPKNRWYITPEIKNITDERSDNITEEFDDSTSVFIQEGARSFTGSIIGVDPVWLGQMQNWKCLTAGIYFVDKSGNLIGSLSSDGKQLNPIRIQDESLSVRLIKGTDTTKQKAELNFIVSQLENDSDLRMIESSNITGQLLGANGLVDVKASDFDAITTTGFKAKMSTGYGGAINPIYAEGLELSDFEAFNLTTSSSVAITSVTESNVVDGEYEFVIPSQSSSDKIRITNATNPVLSKGYDIKTFDVTIP